MVKHHLAWLAEPILAEILLMLVCETKCMLKSQFQYFRFDSLVSASLYFNHSWLSFRIVNFSVSSDYLNQLLSVNFMFLPLAKFSNALGKLGVEQDRRLALSF